jgi:hypothetical protein
MVLKDEHLADKKDFALYFVVYDAVYEGDYSPISASFSELPQLVSRQFWAETSQVFYSTCTFRYNYECDLQRFALSDLPIVPRVMIYAHPWWDSG